MTVLKISPIIETIFSINTSNVLSSLPATVAHVVVLSELENHTYKTAYFKYARELPFCVNN